jgi:hypothetical protein
MKLVPTLPEMIIVHSRNEKYQDETAAFQTICFNPSDNLIITS